MIHAYFTDGFYNMALVFLESLRKTNGGRWRVLLSTRDLSQRNISRLYEVYPNLEVDNKFLDYDILARRAGVSKYQLCRYKAQVENDYVNDSNKVWKLMIAGDDRVRSILSSMLSVEAPILHFDIDTLFMRDISEGFDLVSSNDLCLLLRPNFTPTKGKITISTIGIRTNTNTINFFERWIQHINNILPPHRPLGYGQTSCWYAYEESKHELKVHTLDNRWGYPGKYSNSNDNFVWSGAVHKLTKTDCLKFFMSALHNKEEEVVI